MDIFEYLVMPCLGALWTRVWLVGETYKRVVACRRKRATQCHRRSRHLRIRSSAREWVRANVDQLLQRKVASNFHRAYSEVGAGRVPTRRHRVGTHWLFQQQTDCEFDRSAARNFGLVGWRVSPSRRDGRRSSSQQIQHPPRKSNVFRVEWYKWHKRQVKIKSAQF